MNSRLQAHLHATPEQAARLQQLQAQFALVCNALAPLAQRTHCWNRVALHHMAYRQMREQFPNVGSQMVCNAIYAVSRTCRIVYQGQNSPFHIHRVGADKLPLVHFLPDSPVYFDRHTLSIKDGQASLYTLDGRMRFEIKLPKADLARLATEKLREIVLNGRGQRFSLTFMLESRQSNGQSEPTAGARKVARGPTESADALPAYVRVLQPLPQRLTDEPKELAR